MLVRLVILLASLLLTSCSTVKVTLTLDAIELVPSLESYPSNLKDHYHIYGISYIYENEQHYVTVEDWFLIELE